MRDGHRLAVAPSAAVWPPDDTDESVLGSSLHQTAIRNLIWAINETAALTAAAGTPALWHAGGQTMFSGFQHSDGSPYTTLPDVFVCRHAWDPLRGALSIALDGPHC